MKKYLIYKITNDVNGMFYYGKHITDNENDSYMGSGVYLKRAIRKYGIEHFHKEIVYVFDNEDAMNLKEREIVTENLVKDCMCYNCMVGGEGGDTWTNCNRHHSETTKRRLSEITKRRWNNKEYRDIISDKLRKSFDEKKKSHPERLAAEYKKRGLSVSKTKRERGVTFSESHKQLISAGIKKHYDIIGRKHPIKKPIPFKSENAHGKRIKVYKDFEEHTIYECDKQWYIDNGWALGRNPQNKKPKAHSVEARDASSGKGMLIIHNTQLNVVKRIKPCELEKYLKCGWKRGYLHKKNLRDGLEETQQKSHKLLDLTRTT